MNLATSTSMLVLVFSMIIAAGAEPVDKLSLVEEQEEELVPAMGTTVEFRDIHIGDAFGDAANSYCQTCSCCKASNPNACTNVPCCYALKCNLPGKPPGTCAFTPVACNCNNCS
nr:uncharacterized protein LOC109157826 [Ipomoea batatas]